MRLLSGQPAEKPVPPRPDEYELKIDAQAEKFLDQKQKLTYFLITASVTPIAFVLSFVKDDLRNLSWLWSMMVVGVLLGLGSAGCALRALSFELVSYQSHIACRYARKSWSDLSKDEQDRWDKINQSAALFFRLSFISLFAEMIGFAIFLVAFLIGRSHAGTPRGYWV